MQVIQKMFVMRRHSEHNVHLAQCWSSEMRNMVIWPSAAVHPLTLVILDAVRVHCPSWAWDAMDASHVRSAGRIPSWRRSSLVSEVLWCTSMLNTFVLQVCVSLVKVNLPLPCHSFMHGIYLGEALPILAFGHKNSMGCTWAECFEREPSVIIFNTTPSNHTGNYQ